MPKYKRKKETILPGYLNLISLAKKLIEDKK